MNYSQLQHQIAADRRMRDNAVKLARWNIQHFKTIGPQGARLHIQDARWLNREIIKHKRMIRALQSELPL